MKTKLRHLLPLIWVSFIDSLGWGIAFSVFAALILTDQSSILSSTVSDTTRYLVYEILLGIFCIFTFFFAPVLGGIADKFGRKPGLLISTVGLTIGFVLSAIGAYAASLSLLFLGRIISGATAGSVSIAQAAAVDISQPETKLFNLSLLMFANTIGFAFGPIIGGLLATIHIAPVGTLVFSMAALFGLFAFLGVLFGFQETYVVENKKLTWSDIKGDFLNMKIAFSQPSLAYYLYAILFSMTGFGLLFSNIPVFLTEHFQSSNTLISIVLSASAIAFSIGLLSSARFIFPVFKELNTVLGSFLLQIVIYIALSFTLYSQFKDISLFLVTALLTGVMYIGLLTLISNAASENWQGRIMGVNASIASITWGVGPILSGGLNHFGSRFVFASSAGLLLLSFGIILLFKRRN